MLPSEILRKEIEEKNNINLKQYEWNEELKNQIFSIQLDDTIETQTSTIKEIFEYGFNIGHCGLTSRYICRKFDEAKLFYGKADLLIGTKSAPNGEHAWTIIGGFIIDTTLMICIPESLAKSYGYKKEKEIAHYNARILSEYDTYDSEFDKINQTNKQVINKK